MEGAIPSDLWCLSSLTDLDVSGNHIRCIPTGSIQLSKLESLYMNHWPMLSSVQCPLHPLLSGMGTLCPVSNVFPLPSI